MPKEAAHVAVGRGVDVGPEGGERIPLDGRELVLLVASYCSVLNLPEARRMPRAGIRGERAERDEDPAVTSTVSLTEPTLSVIARRVALRAETEIACL